MALGSFSSGQILAVYGWAMVNWVVFVPVGVALAVLIQGAVSRQARSLDLIA
jgi:hypothetical protein